MTNMEIVQSSESFRVVSGKLEFDCVKGIVRYGQNLYFGKWKTRLAPPPSLLDLYDVKQVKIHDRGPKVLPSWTLASDGNGHENGYIKTPSLFDYATAPDLEQRILHEVEAGEILKKHPHPNIASYRGCLEARGRVSGLCFKRYVSTLADKVNPQHLNKSAFLLSGRPLVDDAMRTQLDGVLSGIRHLHSLGLVHNDITPANIMLEEDGTWVIIDFDSCRRVGEVLRDTATKRTYGWHDPGVTVSCEKNDLDACSELQVWLFGLSTAEFLFR